MDTDPGKAYFLLKIQGAPSPHPLTDGSDHFGSSLLPPLLGLQIIIKCTLITKDKLLGFRGNFLLILGVEVNGKCSGNFVVGAR